MENFIARKIASDIANDTIMFDVESLILIQFNKNIHNSHQKGQNGLNGPFASPRLGRGLRYRSSGQKDGIQGDCTASRDWI